jgi:hypothetical protein
MSAGVEKKRSYSEPGFDTSYTPRQERFENSNQKMTVVINDNPYPIKDYSRYGIAVSLKEDQEKFFSAKPDKDIEIYYGEQLICKGTGTLAHIREGDDGWKTAGIALDQEIKIESLFGRSCAEWAVEAVHDEMKFRAKLNQEFLSFLGDFKFYILTLKEKINQEEEKSKSMIWEEKVEFIESFRSKMALLLRNDLETFNMRLNRVMDSIPKDEFSSYLRIVQEEISPHFLESSFGDRTIGKPLGYAGDFEMMNQIYREGFEGKTLFGQIMHNVMLYEYSARSVRFRRGYFSDYYVKLLEKRQNGVGSKFSSISIASGPAVELQDAIKKLSQDQLDRAEFTLLDLDEKSLLHAQTKINSVLFENSKKANLNYLRYSVKAIAMAPDPKMYLKTYDFMYTAGLYDYLDVRLSKLLTSKLYKSLNPGGTLIIGNFAPNTPTKSFCDLVLDWYLLYKTEEEMLSIAPEGSNVKIERDEEGINLFLVIEKPENN